MPDRGGSDFKEKLWKHKKCKRPKGYLGHLNPFLFLSSHLAFRIPVVSFYFL